MLLNWLIPNIEQIVRQPIYQIETRRIPQRALPRIILYSGYWLIRVTVIVLLLWGAYTLLIVLPMNRSYAYAYSSTLWDSQAIYVLATLAAAILLDLSSVLVSINSITGDKLSGRWDFYLMADMNPLETLQAKHGAAQIRAWRGMIILVALRFSAVLITWLQIFLVALVSSNASIQQVFQEFFNEFYRMPLESAALVIVFLTYLIEPLWRMRTVTAIALAISARGWRFSTSLLAGFAGVVGMWISQGMLVGFVFWITSYIFTHSSITFDYEYSWRIFIFFYVVGFACMIYFYYRFTRIWSLKSAAKAAFRT